MRSLVTFALALWLAATPAPGWGFKAKDFPYDGGAGLDEMAKELDAIFASIAAAAAGE